MSTAFHSIVTDLHGVYEKQCASIDTLLSANLAWLKESAEELQTKIHGTGRFAKFTIRLSLSYSIA